MAGVKFTVGGDASKGLRVLEDFKRKAQKVALSISDGFKIRVGQKLFDGLQGAASALPGLMMESITAASDLNEVLSKTTAIFGDQTNAIVGWSQQSSEAFGQSRRAALEAASDFGNLFTAMGVGQREASQMSMQLVELASDLASFSNTSPADAAMALGAALRGESEPIRRYGVLLDEATLKAEAFEQGVGDGKAQLAPASRALAAYSVILRQTATAQGDFARTSDGLANSQRTIAAQLEDLKTVVGQELAPAFADLSQEIKGIDFQAVAAGITKVIDAGKGAGDLFAKFSPLGRLIASSGKEVEQSGYNEYLMEMNRLNREIQPKEVLSVASSQQEIDAAIAGLEKIREQLNEGAAQAISEANARGATDEAERLSRALETYLKLNDAKRVELQLTTDEQLAANQATKAAEQAERDYQKALEATEKKLAAAREKFREVADKRELSGPIEDQIEMLNRSEEFLRQQLQGSARTGTGEQIGEQIQSADAYAGQDRDLEVAGQIIEIERQRAELQRELAEDQEEQAAKRAEALAKYDEEMALLQAELAGNKEKLAQLQREARIRQVIAELTEAGVDPAEAKARAESLADAEQAQTVAEEAEKLREKQDELKYESSIGAIAAMQRIGGGGGFAASGVDYARQQADMQRQMVALLDQIARQTSPSLND